MPSFGFLSRQRFEPAHRRIHTDFEKGFIKAEVIGFNDLVETGSIAEARAKGKARIEGKDYVMQDGDVVEFRHS